MILKFKEGTSPDVRQLPSLAGADVRRIPGTNAASIQPKNASPLKGEDLVLQIKKALKGGCGERRERG